MFPLAPGIHLPIGHYCNTVATPTGYIPDVFSLKSLYHFRTIVAPMDDEAQTLPFYHLDSIPYLNPSPLPPSTYPPTLLPLPSHPPSITLPPLPFLLPPPPLTVGCHGQVGHTPHLPMRTPCHQQ